MKNLKNIFSESTIEEKIFLCTVDLFLSQVTERLEQFNEKFWVRINFALTSLDELLAQCIQH